MARATNDVRQLNPMMNPGVSLITESIIGIIAPLVFIALLRVELLVAPLLFVIAYLFALRRYVNQLTPVAGEQRWRFGEMNAGLTETITGIEVVKSAAQEAQERRKFVRNARRVRDLYIKQGQIEARYLPLLLLGFALTGAFAHGLWLVARFYEFQGGQLLVDGQDIRTCELHSYRRQLGIVPQTPFLFAGTVVAAASRVGGGDGLDALPQGLATLVGEQGKGISMGQRQLVALARVLLQNPAIIILDEATGSVDPLTEAQIQEGLDVVLRDRTAIVIAHRLSTIKSADRIIVLSKGQIIEAGDHAALTARGGHYAELYNTYFRHQSLEYIESWRKETLESDAVGESHAAAQASRSARSR